MATSAQDMDFAVLVGKAFLRELDAGKLDSAIAFGRAFLLSLGMRGPEEDSRHHAHGRSKASDLALAEN